MNSFKISFLLSLIFSCSFVLAGFNFSDSENDSSPPNSQESYDMSVYESDSSNFDWDEDWNDAQLSELDNDEMAFEFESSNEEDDVAVSFNLKDAIQKEESVEIKKNISEWKSTEEKYVQFYGNPLELAIALRKPKILATVLGTRFGTSKWINELNNRGFAPIHQIKKGDEVGLELLKILLGHGAFIDKKSRLDGGTAVWCSTHNGHNNNETESLPVVKLLANCGADLTITCKHNHGDGGCTPEKRAEKSGFTTIKNYLKNFPKFSYPQLYSMTTDTEIRNIVLKQAVLYKKVGLMQKVFNEACDADHTLTKKKLERDAIGLALQLQNDQKLITLLKCAMFYLTEEHVELIRKRCKYLLEQQDVDKAGDLLRSVAIDRQEKLFMNQLRNSKLTDVIIKCNAPVKFTTYKRKSSFSTLSNLKKYKQDLFNSYKYGNK